MARVEDLWVRKDKTRRPGYGKGLRYRAEWTPPGGSKTSKTFATKAAATDFLAAQVSDINRGVYVASRKKLLLSEYAVTWKEHQLHQRASSREQIEARFRLNIIPSLGGMAMDSVQRPDVQAAVGEWAKTLAPSTVKVAYGYLAAMFKAAVLDGVVAKTPCVGIKLPKVEQPTIVPLTTATVQELANSVWRPYQPMVVVCAATGLRSSELRGLTWDRVDFKASMISIDRQLIGESSKAPEWGPPKTASSRRRIHVGAATLQVLRDLSQKEHGPGGLVFHSSGRAITRHTAGEAWRHVRESTPAVGKGWHELRHYHASQLISGGMSPVAVAHRLGHKDATETLKTYGHLWPDDDTRAATLTDGLVKLIAHESRIDTATPTE
ncbi:tyrosine-type recombinase/integrase [Arthrobacter sp. 1P04PC]|uniref:tyrosine-type recombinase/integrase n=1 Tax=unclassified Arthrobacter TaxID=235627 RepID=UPI00399F2133